MLVQKFKLTGMPTWWLSYTSILGVKVKVLDWGPKIKPDNSTRSRDLRPNPISF